MADVKPTKYVVEPIFRLADNKNFWEGKGRILKGVVRVVILQSYMSMEARYFRLMLKQ